MLRMTNISSLRNWVDGDCIHSHGEDWRWSSSDGKDQEFKKDQMELESETKTRLYITFLPALLDSIDYT